MSSTEFVIVVPKGKTKERLDVFLTHHVENATRSKVQQAIKEGYVLVNGITVKPSHTVTGGEVIKVHLPKSPPPDVIAENIPLDIVYEDDYLIVVNKPAGMVTHPAYGNYSGTLVNALLHHSQYHLSNVQTVSAKNGLPRPGIVHRLDKDTSGLIVIAKDNATHAQLAKQFEQRTIEREYWAIVWGRFEKSKVRGQGSEVKKITGIIEAPLERSKSDRKKIAVTKMGKHAVTEYLVLEEFDYLSLIRCKLRTGRTHQIRVHMHHIGHPVFGDATYGGRRISWGGADKKKKEEVQHLLTIIQRQALHAKTIGFIHPATKLKLKFDSLLPQDFNNALSLLRR
jgi:23S rRNA pseudouridine1911/1915/1917 synthase